MTGAVRSVFRQVRAQRRVPPHVVDYVRRRAGQTWSGMGMRVRRARVRNQYLAARRAIAATPGSDDATIVYVDGGWQIASGCGLTAVRQVAEANLAAVCRLLDDAGVPYFVREAWRPGQIVIGVAVEDRPQALRALTEAAPRDYLYLRDARRGRPVLLRGGVRVSGGLAQAERVLVYRNHRLDDEQSVGVSHACVIEFWRRAGTNLRPPAGADPGRVVPEETTAATVVVGRRQYPTLSVFADHRAMAADPPFPVDVVYTWVDDSDPEWQRRLAQVRARFDGGPAHAEAMNDSRYRNHDELRYSLRSLMRYAHFVRRVFIVSAGQVPEWLDTSHPLVTVVDHAAILPPGCLPTFNSHAIEARLHHIDGLAEHYLYLNDDFFFGREVAATTFFTPNGLPRVFVDEEAPIPAGPPAPTDRPVDSAAKNVRRLVREHLGARVGRKIRHVPYPQRRSVLAEMEERFAEDFERTAASRFRRPSDVSIPSCLFHYYAYATGRAVPGEIQAEYVNIASRWAQLQMQRLLQRRDRDVVCLNETDVVPDRAGAVDDAVMGFLRSYFPTPSPLEVESGQRSARKNETMSVNP